MSRADDRIRAMFTLFKNVSLNTLIFLLLISIASLLINGYQFSTGDQSTYVPQVLRRVDPSLYTRDYLSNISEGELSLLFPIIASVIRVTNINIEWLYFGLYVFILFLTILSIYSLSFTLAQNKLVSAVAAIILALPKFVGGTNNTTLDISLVPRFFVLPLILYSLNLITRKRYLLSAFLTGVIFLFHPYSATYLSAFLIGFIVFDKKWNLLPRVTLTGLLPASILIISKAPGFLSQNSKFIMPADWLSIIRMRQPYLFVSEWNITGWGSLFIALVLAGAFILLFNHEGSQTKRRFNQILIQAIVIATVVSLLHFFLGEVAKIAIVLQFQLMRIWLIPIYLAYISTAYLIVLTWKQAKPISRSAAIMLFIIVITNFGKVKASSVEIPGGDKREWDRLQVWIRENTPVDSLIINPTTRVGFRIHSRRSIIAEIKDGSSGLYSYELAKSWQERVSDLTAINTKTEAEIINLKKKYRADYLITFQPKEYLNFTLIHQTETFIVYKL